jgi:hypothetical protein
MRLVVPEGRRFHPGQQQGRLVPGAVRRGLLDAAVERTVTVRLTVR